jgi:UDP-glucose 4-epimerase
VIPIFVRKALAGEPVTIAGEGLQSRRFVYVEDLAEGVVRGLGPEAGGRVYNLVGDESVTVRGLPTRSASLVVRSTFVPHPRRAPRTSPAPRVGRPRRRELGWRPATASPKGLRRYVEWHATTRAAGRRRAPAPRTRRAAPPPAVAPRFASLVLSWLTGAGRGRGLAGLPGLGARGRPHRRVGPDHRGAEPSARPPGTWPMALDGPRNGAVDRFTGWALAATAWSPST